MVEGVEDWSGLKIGIEGEGEGGECFFGGER